MIAIIDSGVANVASVRSALQRLGAQVCVTAEVAVLERASHMILPGVGAAAPAMRRLRERGLIEYLRANKKPLLGICLGMQLLFEKSDEGAGADCLGVISGKVVKMTATPDKAVPHMGWNSLRIKQHGHSLLAGINDGAFVYFVHSYVADIDAHNAAAQNVIIAEADHGKPFPAIVAQDNFMGCQFHPERSGEVGATILRNFINL